MGYWIAYGQNFSMRALPCRRSWLQPDALFLPAHLAAAIPAIISGGIAERAKMRSQGHCHADSGRTDLSVL